MSKQLTLHTCSFGALIKRLREEKQLSQRKVAEALDIDVAVLSRMENDNGLPQKRMEEAVIILSRLFGSSEEELRTAYLSDRIAALLDGSEHPEQILKAVTKKIGSTRSKKRN